MSLGQEAMGERIRRWAAFGMLKQQIGRSGHKANVRSVQSPPGAVIRWQADDRL